jgi:hypothetical protein
MSIFETETYQGMDFNIKRFNSLLLVSGANSFHPGDKSIMEFNSKVEKVCDGILSYKDFLIWVEDEIKTFDWMIVRKKDYPLDSSTNKIVNSSSSIYTSSTNNSLPKSTYESKEMLSSGILPSPPPKIIIVNKGTGGVSSIEKVNKYPKRNLDINPIIVKKSNYYLVNNIYVYLPSKKSIVGKLENNKLVTMTNIPLSEIVSKLLM